MADDLKLNPAAIAALVKGDIGNFLVAATPGGIEAQEAQGQRNLVANFNRLPKSAGLEREFPKEMLERLGFVIGESIDEIFIGVTPPAGWSMRPTGHSMWNEIVDDKGRVRASVFYKAAFYDRKAHFRFEPRYRVKEDYVDGEKYEDGTVQVSAFDHGTDTILFQCEPIHREREYWKKVTVDEHKCEQWLEENFPDFRNVEAYW